MIRFIYNDDSKQPQREAVVSRFCEIARNFISLPDIIEIEFGDIGKSVYGETLLTPRFKNRIRINSQLDLRSIVNVLAHELLHLEQTHTGILIMRRDNIYMWKNKLYNTKPPNEMTPEEWEQLPWEMDVANKQQKLLENVLISG